MSASSVARILALALFALAAPLATAPSAHAAGPASVADLAEGLLGAVVNISTSQNPGGSDRPLRAPRPKVPDGSPFQDFFDEFFNQQQQGNPSPRRRRPVQSLGSGFVIDPEGIIITNNHVIADADEITIDFKDGSKLTAEVIGTDAKTDIAVLKVEPTEPLQAVPFGDSGSSRIGDWVMAIGNPFGQGSSVSLGIISAINRDIRSGPYDNFIQTDAAINRGNSGGPLFNMDGEVIGINTAIISPSGGSIGLGFSIPSQLAKRVISQLREFGETRRGWLGVSIQPVTDDIAESLEMASTDGALVAGVADKSPAKSAGLQVSDVVLEFDGRKVRKMRDLPRIVANTAVGKSVEVKVLRKGEMVTLTVIVGRLEDGEKQMAANAEDEEQAEPEVPESVTAMGVTFEELTDEARALYKIKSDVQGVLIAGVDEGSTAEEKGIKVGSVLLEFGQEAMTSVADVEKRLAEFKKEGRKKALMLISGEGGQLGFVVLTVE